MNHNQDHHPEETNILLVHNQPEERLQKKLSQPSYQLVIANSAAEAFSQMLRQHFTLIFLAPLPGMEQAIDLIKLLANMYDIPIVYIPS